MFITSTYKIHIKTTSKQAIPVASPGFVAMRGEADFRNRYSSGLMTNSCVTNALLIERAVSC